MRRQTYWQTGYWVSKPNEPRHAGSGEQGCTDALASEIRDAQSRSRVRAYSIVAEEEGTRLSATQLSRGNTRAFVFSNACSLKMIIELRTYETAELVFTREERGRVEALSIGFVHRLVVSFATRAEQLRSLESHVIRAAHTRETGQIGAISSCLKYAQKSSPVYKISGQRVPGAISDPEGVRVRAL